MHLFLSAILSNRIYEQCKFFLINQTSAFVRSCTLKGFDCCLMSEDEKGYPCKTHNYVGRLRYVLNLVSLACGL